MGFAIFQSSSTFPFFPHFILMIYTLTYQGLMEVTNLEITESQNHVD